MPIFFFLILFFSSLCCGESSGCNYIDDPYPGNCGYWQNTEACFSDVSSAQSWCLSHQLPKIACTKQTISSKTEWGGVDVPVGTVYFVTYDNGCPGQFNISWVLPSLDTDGDGIPDSKDPCPNNPNPDCRNPDGDPNKDTDGDGIPDDEDPCPTNPNPNCQDPNDNPPPEFPDEIVIGDCVVDISEITAIFKAEGGVFPINWIVAFGSALRAFTQVQASQAPSIQYSFSFFGKSYEIDLHLERFNAIASYVRFVSGLLAMFYFIRFANRGFFKVITGSGT